MNELETLIAEQAKDDTYHVFSVSIDTWKNGVNTEYRKRKLVTDPRHGTNGCYTALGCRCDRCRAAATAAKREWRRKNLVDRGPYTYVLCCEDCGSNNVRRERRYG